MAELRMGYLGLLLLQFLQGSLTEPLLAIGAKRSLVEGVLVGIVRMDHRQEVFDQY
jgi:hypothetical protein